MKLLSTPKTIVRILLLCLLMTGTSASYGQIYKYTNDSVGNYDMVATNATGSALGRINTAVSPSVACRHGFSSKGFPNTATFATTLPADTLIVTANSGYALHVTSFSIGIRKSPTGPDSARLAYSTNGGATWTDQGFAYSPNNFGCDTMLNVSWTHAVTVSSPNKLEFAIFGYKAGSTSGTFQIDTLTINGTVMLNSAVISERIDNDNSFIVFPNPAKEMATVSYHLSKAETVSLRMYNIAGREVSVVESATQSEGDYRYPVSIAAPGMYFVRLSIGDAVFTRKILKE
jgi:hypothetical protein